MCLNEIRLSFWFYKNILEEPRQSKILHHTVFYSFIYFIFILQRIQDTASRILQNIG